MITDGTPVLTLGEIDLMGGDKTGSYWFEALGDDASLGNPEAVTRQVAAFLMDGAISVTDGYNNREMTLRVAVCGEDSYGLAVGESALVGEVGKANTLTWAPPNHLTGFGAVCVFDVVNSTLNYEFDDIGELSLERIYTLTVEAQPFARAQNPLSEISEAPPTGAPPTNTLVLDGTSTSGWAGTSSDGGAGTLGTSGGIITLFKGFGPSTSATRWIRLTKTGLSESMTSTPFVRIKFGTDLTQGGSDSTMTRSVTINGVAAAEVARDADYGWYACPTSTLTSIAITCSGKFPTAAGSVVIRVDDVYRTDSTTLSTTTGQRQTFRTLTVNGSTRTQGSLAVESETAALGSTLIYTCPAAATLQQPPLRALRTSGPAETTDATLISGKYSDLTTDHVFDIPAPNVPAGGYLLIARAKVTSGTAWTLTWSGSSVVNGAVVDGSLPSSTTAGTMVTNTWTTVTVGRLVLPTYNLGSTGLVRVRLQGSANMLLDEAWLFNADLGRLTIAECGTASPAAGGTSNRLWLDAATVSSPVPSVWMGFAADRSDAHGAGPALTSFAAHEFLPPSMNVFVVTSNAVDTTVTLGPYYPRFHTHVVES